MICFNHDNPFDEAERKVEKILQKLLKQVLYKNNPSAKSLYEGSCHTNLTTLDVEKILYQLFFVEECSSVNLEICREEDGLLSVIVNKRNDE